MKRKKKHGVKAEWMKGKLSGSPKVAFFLIDLSLLPQASNQRKLILSFSVFVYQKDEWFVVVYGSTVGRWDDWFLQYSHYRTHNLIQISHPGVYFQFRTHIFQGFSYCFAPLRDFVEFMPCMGFPLTTLNSPCLWNFEFIKLVVGNFLLNLTWVNREIFITDWFPILVPSFHFFLYPICQEGNVKLCFMFHLILTIQFIWYKNMF